jgi:hypothetical protein
MYWYILQIKWNSTKRNKLTMIMAWYWPTVRRNVTSDLWYCSEIYEWDLHWKCSCCPTSYRVRVTLRLTVSQSVCLGVEPIMWTFDQILLPFQEFGLEFVLLSLWRALFDEKRVCPRVSFVSESESLYGWQSVSQSWCRAHFVDVWPDIASFSGLWIWNLLSCLCGAPSLTRGRVCPL